MIVMESVDALWSLYIQSKCMYNLYKATKQSAEIKLIGYIGGNAADASILEHDLILIIYQCPSFPSKTRKIILFSQLN